MVDMSSPVRRCPGEALRLAQTATVGTTRLASCLTTLPSEDSHLYMTTVCAFVSNSDGGGLTDALKALAVVHR